MKLIKIFLVFLLVNASSSLANNVEDFNKWKIEFKDKALANNISEITFDIAMADVKFYLK